MKLLSIYRIYPLLLATALSLPIRATAQLPATEPGGPPALTESELTFMLRQMEKSFENRFEEQATELAAQRELIDAQANTIQSLEARIEELAGAPKADPGLSKQQRQELESQKQAIAAQTDAIKALQNQFDQFSADQQQTLSQADQQIRARLENLEGTMTRLQTDETTAIYDESTFPGAFPVPGMAAAIKIGGFAKANVVQSIDGFSQAENRFIVGLIPTRGATTGDEEANLNVRQSRLNFEYRQETPKGQLRAFIEGDFAGTDSGGRDVLRLRHAFGQFQDILAGKYWTNFMDIQASPEEIDFEGVNGRVNVRQTQLRYFPEFGNGWNLIVSLEDPQPDVTGGDGLSVYPDFIASVRRQVRDDWNVKFSGLLRSIEARWDINDNVKEDDIGWGFSVSGQRAVDWWDPRDNWIVQLNYGEGIGRYINDLSTVGGQDAAFSDTGEFAALPVFAGLVSFQKWWRDGLRSTAIFSVVDIDNEDFQPGDAYNKTWRFSTNLVWSPVPAIDLGGELLFGGREDKDGSSGDATQFQLAARYRF